VGGDCRQGPYIQEATQKGAGRKVAQRGKKFFSGGMMDLWILQYAKGVKKREREVQARNSG